jgi:hypothetical protein
MVEVKGRIGLDGRSSTPWRPQAAQPPTGVPNVPLVVLDGVAFA